MSVQPHEEAKKKNNNNLTSVLPNMERLEKSFRIGQKRIFIHSTYWVIYENDNDKIVDGKCEVRFF